MDVPLMLSVPLLLLVRSPSESAEIIPTPGAVTVRNTEGADESSPEGGLSSFIRSLLSGIPWSESTTSQESLAKEAAHLTRADEAAPPRGAFDSGPDADLVPLEAMEDLAGLDVPEEDLLVSRPAPTVASSRA